MNNTFAIFFAKDLIYISLIIFGFYFLFASKYKEKRIVLVSSLSATLSFISVFILNHLYYNPRPFAVNHVQPLIAHLPDNGFPSDHAILSALIASIAFVFNKKLGIMLWIFAILISLSRVYLQLHHNIDVLASFIVAIMMVSISDYIISKPISK